MDDVSALVPIDRGFGPQQQVLGHTYGDINVYGTAQLGDRYDVHLPSHVTIVDHHQRLLESLRFSKMNARLNSIAESHSETFQWIFEESTENKWDSFTDWLQSGQEIYLIEGKAGSGKSTLMKFICNHERTTTLLSGLDTTPPLVLCHFLWLAGSLLQRSYRGLLACLLFQLVECSSVADINFVLETNEHRSKRSLADWSDVALESCLLGALQAVPIPTLVFIDGLDEFDEAERPIRLVKFIHKLKCVNNVKICVSSRPTLWLPQLSPIAKTLRLQDLTYWDIKRFAGDVLQAEFDFYCADLTKTETDEILEVIRQQAEGVFLWVKYALHSLSEGFSGMDDIRTLKERLLELPKGMQELYEHIWRRHENCNANHRVEAAIFFNCAPYIGSLTTLELAVIMDEPLQRHFRDKAAPFPSSLLKQKCSQIERKLMVRTGGLLLLEAAPKGQIERTPSATTRIAFLHRTVRDFLFETEYGRSIVALPNKDMAYIHQSRLMAYMVPLIQDSVPPNVLDALEMSDWLAYWDGAHQLPVPLETLCWIDRAYETLTRYDYPASSLGTDELRYRTDSNAHDFTSLMILHGAFECAKTFIKDRELSSSYLGRLLAYSFVSSKYHVLVDSDSARGWVQFVKHLINYGSDLVGKQVVSITVQKDGEGHCRRMMVCPPLSLLVRTMLEFMVWEPLYLVSLMDWVMPAAINVIPDSTVIQVTIVDHSSAPLLLKPLQIVGRLLYSMDVHVGKLYSVLQELVGSCEQIVTDLYWPKLINQISTAVTNIHNVMVRVGDHDSWEGIEPNDEVKSLILGGVHDDCEGTHDDYEHELARRLKAVSKTNEQGDVLEMLEERGLILPKDTEYIPWDINAYASKYTCEPRANPASGA
ncbi:hypothetical protein PMZ80_006493 [Knufia obscura]|uniref:NACHT domain-containing protein n=2 Tax=Knufia TaxID=430999 RepID=A0AAN8I3Y6_9EURO|nr:hypothetical protein PMZ80_006493 [Knufia obscura]KAK5953357.1 hypothetical protein OHC33_005301 [Knufia fluminis]